MTGHYAKNPCPVGKGFRLHFLFHSIGFHTGKMPWVQIIAWLGGIIIGQACHPLRERSYTNMSEGPPCSQCSYLCEVCRSKQGEKDWKGASANLLCDPVLVKHSYPFHQYVDRDAHQNGHPVDSNDMPMNGICINDNCIQIRIWIIPCRFWSRGWYMCVSLLTHTHLCFYDLSLDLAQRYSFWINYVKYPTDMQWN